MPTSRLCVIAEASSFFAAMFNITARSIGEKLSTEVNAFGLNSIIWLEVFHRFVDVVFLMRPFRKYTNDLLV